MEARRFKFSILAALIAFTAALGSMFYGLWSSSLSEFILTSGQEKPDILEVADHRYFIWVVSRNAYTLSKPSTQLFNAEVCYPAANSLTFMHPLITVGMLGVPAYLATGDPIVTYNFAFVALVLLSAMAMYFLVKEWTGVTAAGIVAGLIYAYSPFKLNFVYAFSRDTAWTVLALLFARRFFAHGRWTDAIRAAVCCSLQAASTFYPFVAGVTLAVPLVLWLVLSYGIKNLRVAPCLVGLAILGAAMLFVFGPYLELESSLGTLSGAGQQFAAWWTLLPWNTVGWTGSALVLASLVLGQRRTVGGIDGDPRYALVLGSALVAVMATGGNVAARITAEHLGQPPPVALPNLYEMLATVVPGLELLRSPQALGSGVHIALCILSGLGAAGLIRLAPRRVIPYVAASIVVVCWVDTTRPTLLGMEPRAAYRLLRVRPSDEAIKFFQTLEQVGNDGPVLELPISIRNPFYSWTEASSQVLLSAYHHRRTSGCVNAFRSPVMFKIEALAKRLPSRRAIRKFRGMGFTTIIIHHGPEEGGRRDLLQSFERAAGRSDNSLRRIYGNDSMTAFALVD